MDPRAGRPDVGVAVATFGAGIVVSGVACALMPPEAAIPPLARLVQLTGLGLLVVSGGALLSTHPAPIAETGTPRPHSLVGDPDPGVDLDP